MSAIWRRIELLASCAVGLAACAGPAFSPEEAPEYLIRHDQTPFYKQGPQQASAPDAWLAQNDRVRVLRRELGYSYALLQDGEAGYVANDELEAAPELGNETRVRSDPAPVKRGQTAPRPDLNAMPADAPPAS